MAGISGNMETQHHRTTQPCPHMQLNQMPCTAMHSKASGGVVGPKLFMDVLAVGGEGDGR